MSTESNQKIDHHAFDVLTSLEDLRTSNVVCDFTVKVGDDSFTAHRTVLAACSPYFRGMFSSDMTEANEGLVDMKGVEANAVKLAIDFMYTGKVELSTENAPTVLHVADFMQMERLKDICFKFLVEKITAENCFEVKRLILTYTGQKWEQECEKYIEQNFGNIIPSTDFQSLALKEMQHYVIKLQDQYTVAWGATTAWIRHDTDERLTHLTTLLQTFCHKLSFQYIFDTVLKDDLLRESDECKEMLLSCLFSSEKVVKSNLTCSNCLELDNLACVSQKWNMSKVHQVIMKFISSNLSTLVDDPKFRNMDKNSLQWILHKTSLDHKTAWSAITARTRTQIKEIDKTVHLLDLIKTINLQEFPFDFLLETVWAGNLVQKTRDCRDYLSSSLLSRPDIVTKINHDNCFLLKNLAKNFDHRMSVTVEYRVIQFMASALENVYQKREFQQLDKEEVHLVLCEKKSVCRPPDFNTLGYYNKSKWMETCPDHIKFRAAITWVKFDGCRNEHLPELLRTVQLQNFERGFIKSKIRSEPVVTSSLGCMTMLADHFY